MPDQVIIAKSVHFHARRRGRKEIVPETPAPLLEAPGPRVPRIARLMALALRCEALVRSGEVSDYATLARVGGVSRARVTQIMNLLHLAPDIQEEILFMAGSSRGPAAILWRDLQRLAAVADWEAQRQRWRTAKPSGPG